MCGTHVYMQASIHTHKTKANLKKMGEKSPKPYCIQVMKRQFCLNIRDRGCRDGSAVIGSAHKPKDNMRGERVKIDVAVRRLSQLSVRWW